jgi:hypothetical protein
MTMKKRFMVVLVLILGAACSVHAQDAAFSSMASGSNVARDFANTSAAEVSLAASPSDSHAAPVFVAMAESRPPMVAPDTAEPASPPKFFSSSRDDYRWQLAIGPTFYRFRSAFLNASEVGLTTSIAYYTNEWFGVEGNITSTFAPTIYVKEHVKFLSYTGGVRIGSRRNRWEPWAHLLFGGAHLQPQLAGFSRSSYSIQGGGGADYRLLPRVSLRVGADWVRTGFYKGSQNNFQITGGVVIHF